MQEVPLDFLVPVFEKNTFAAGPLQDGFEVDGCLLKKKKKERTFSTDSQLFRVTAAIFRKRLVYVDMYLREKVTKIFSQNDAAFSLLETRFSLLEK